MAEKKRRLREYSQQWLATGRASQLYINYLSWNYVRYFPPSLSPV